MSGPERGAPAAAVYALFFGLGAVSLITQAFLFREVLVVVHGTELILGLLFASWLFWIGAAALAGVALAQRVARPLAHLRGWVALGALSPLAQIELVRSAQRILHLPRGLILSLPQAALLSLAALAPFCWMIGATFPLGCRVLSERGARGVGHLYAAEAAGALAGGVLGSFVLVGRVAPLAAAVGGAAVLVLVSAFLDRGRGRALALVAALLLAAAVPASGRWDEGSRRRELQALMPGQELLATFDTPYEQVAVGRLEGQLTVYGDGLPVATIPDPYETPGVVYRILAQAPHPRRVLVVGAPTTGLAREIAGALDERAETRGTPLTFVFADRLLVRELLPLLPAAEAAAIRDRVRLVDDDPRAFLRASPGAWDLVFVDMPEPVAAHVNRFYTREFFATARRALGPTGVLAFHLPSSSDYVGREVSMLSVSVRKALGEAFSSVVVTPGEESYFFASAAAGVLTKGPAVVAARLRAHPRAAPFLDDIVLDYEPGRLGRIEALMSAGGDAVTNSDDHPSSYHYSAVLWERFSSDTPTEASRLARAHAFTRSLGPLHAVGGVGALLALWLALRRASPRRAAAIDVGVAVGVAGLASMAFNLVLLIAYQSRCGALYQRLAVMSALFMMGVALGSGAAARAAPRLTRPGTAVGALLVLTALAALLLPAALAALEGTPPWTQELGHGALFVGAGSLLGAGYPLNAGALLARAGEGEQAAARAGGLIDALDHLGATLGALAVGTVVLPAVGAVATLRLAALVTAAIGAVWLGLAARPASRR